MRAPIILVCILAGVHLPVAAAVVAPVMPTDSVVITPDAKFTDIQYNPDLASVSGTDADGFDFRKTNASASFKETRTVSMSVGGGTRTLDSSYSFSSDQRQRFDPTDSGFRFEASTDIQAGLNSRLTLSTYGNFIFIVTDGNASKLAIDRKINFVVDQPMHLLIHLSGLTSNTDFKGVFNNFQLRGGELRPFVDNIFMFTTTTYNASESTVFSGSGSRKGVDYSLEGSADADGIHLLMTLQPTVDGTSPDLQLSWALRNDLVAQAGPSAFGWNRQVTASAGIQEMIVLTAIPEPSAAALILIPALAGLGRRNRPPR